MRPLSPGLRALLMLALAFATFLALSFMEIL